MTRALVENRPSRAQPDAAYFELVRRFPLRPIANRRDHAAAGTILDELVGREDLTSGQRDYIDALTHFVAAYEQQVHGRRFRQLTPIEIVRELMKANNMNTTDLGEILGTRGLASEVLNGKRGLSKSLIARLARRFQVDPGLFLDRSARVAK